MISLSEILDNPEYGKYVKNVIYKITNIANNKVYIGQTRTSLRKRLLSHISHAKQTTKSRKHYFQRALQKYDLKCFSVEILETCNESDLNNREIYWISHFNSFDSKTGYNSTFGGDGCSISRDVSQTTRDKLSTVHKNKWKLKEYREMQKEHRVQSWKKRSYKIIQLTNSMSFIKRWESKKEITEVFGAGNFGRLTKNRPRVYSHGFVWVTEEEYRNIQNSTPLLVQLDYFGNVINYYYDYLSANREIYKLTGNFGSTQFDCNTPRNKTKGTKKGGYIWLLYDSYKSNNYEYK